MSGPITARAAWAKLSPDTARTLIAMAHSEALVENARRDAAALEKKKRAAEDAYFARTNVAVAARKRRLADY